MTIAISEKAARAAMYALERKIRLRYREDDLDGAPSRRGRHRVTSDDHQAHSEIAAALGEDGGFGISAHADPNPKEISRAADLAKLLLEFWIATDYRAEDPDKRIPPGPSSDLAATVAVLCWVSPSRARSIVNIAAQAHGYQLMSMGDWLVHEEVRANG